MITKNKLVKGINHKVWLQFSGHCKAKGVKIGNELSDILSSYLDKGE